MCYLPEFNLAWCDCENFSSNFEALNIRNSRVPNSLLWRSVSWRRNNVLVAKITLGPTDFKLPNLRSVIFRVLRAVESSNSEMGRFFTPGFDGFFPQKTARRDTEISSLATHPWRHSLLPWFETWSGLLKKSMSSRVTHNDLKSFRFVKILGTSRNLNCMLYIYVLILLYTTIHYLFIDGES